MQNVCSPSDESYMPSGWSVNGDIGTRGIRLAMGICLFTKEMRCDYQEGCLPLSCLCFSGNTMAASVMTIYETMTERNVSCCKSWDWSNIDNIVSVDNVGLPVRLFIITCIWYICTCIVVVHIYKIFSILDVLSVIEEVDSKYIYMFIFLVQIFVTCGLVWNVYEMLCTQNHTCRCVSVQMKYWVRVPIPYLTVSQLNICFIFSFISFFYW